MVSPNASPRNTARKATTSKTKHNDHASEAHRKQRRVEFNNIVIVTEIPSHRVYTFDQRFSVWYSQSEYRCFSLQERTRKNINANNTTELSDRVREPSNLKRKAIRANIQKRKFKSQLIVGDKQKSAKISTQLQEAVSLLVQARNITNRRLAQIQWQMQGNQRLPNAIPAWSFHSSIPIPTRAMQTKQTTMLSQIPFDFSNNTPMTDPNSPAARGA